MAISAEVLNDALQELAPRYQNLFERWSPVLKKIVTNGNIERSRLRGPFKEFRVITGGPGDVTHIVDGGERLAATRADITAKGDTRAARLIYSFLVPDKDMAEATGPADVEHLIKQYPEAALMDFHQRITKQLVNGNGSGVGGFLTLNGDTTYSPHGTARTGVFDFDATQTDTVFGLAKEDATSGAVTGWKNGFGNITSMASDGISTLRKEYFRASRKGKLLGPVDLLIADETSFSNYIDLLDDRIIVEDQVKGEAGVDDVTQGVKFLKATMYIEEFLDPSASTFTTTAAQNGVIYGLKTSTWHAYTLGSDDQMETKGDFSVRGPLRRPDMDAHQFEYVLYMGMYCDFLAANFAVTGGNIA